MKILITGGTNGMGKGVVKTLAAADNQKHEIIILCRSKALGEAVIKEFEETTLNKNISLVICDLNRLSDVKNAINELHSKHEYLDSIFINAGIGYAAGRTVTEDGLESHFQVNYLSQFILTLNLLELLEKSKEGGRVIFNTPSFGEMHWDDLQMSNKWDYESAIGQAMVAKRMFLYKLHELYRSNKQASVSFIGFQISKTVWSNQLNIIPTPMRLMATIMRLFGLFISIEKCGKIMAPLFIESQDDSFKKSGKLITWKNNEFVEINEKETVLKAELQDKLWQISLDLCEDERTREIAEAIAARI